MNFESAINKSLPSKKIAPPMELVPLPTLFEKLHPMIVKLPFSKHIAAPKTELPLMKLMFFRVTVALAILNILD